MLRVLAVPQEHSQLPQLQHLQAALTATVCAKSTQGDGSVLQAAERLAAGGQLSPGDLADLYWGVVTGTAAAFTAAQEPSQASNRRELLLLYWQRALQSASAPSSSAAAAVVSAMAADTLAPGGGSLAQQLLVQPLPTPVLAALIQAAAALESGSALLPQLLAYAVQTQQLQQLPAAALTQLLGAGLAAEAVSFADCLQLVDALLQQQQQQQDTAVDVDAAAAQLLVEAVATSSSRMLQFVELVQRHSGSAAVSALLCSTLQAACEHKGKRRRRRPTGDAQQGTVQLSWQLFEQLQQCGRPSREQLGACSVLLVQQSQAGEAAAAQRVSAVWQHCCEAAGGSAAAFRQLSPSAQPAVLSALVSRQQAEQAVALVQHSPDLLPHLAELLQQAQQGGQPTDAPLLLQALQLCVSAGNQHAATAAETLTGLLIQRGSASDALQGELAAGLVQLLCANSKTTAALQLLPALLTGSEAVQGPAAAAAALVAAAGAVTQEGTAKQQTQLLAQLGGADASGCVQAALSAALAQPAPAAVGLLLRAVRDSRPDQALGTLLTAGQLGQLCKLVCSSVDSGSATALPSVQELAHECCDSPGVPGSVAADLLNMLLKQQPELQTSLETEADTSLLLARLCYQQLRQLPAGCSSADVEASLADWVPALRPEAAAAALSAAWQHRSRSALQAAAVPLLCLELYRCAAPQAKSEGNSLVFELGLMAAAEAGQQTGAQEFWDRGEGIIGAARKAVQHAADSSSSKGSKRGVAHSEWLPLLPEACCALLSVIVHTASDAGQGVAAAGQLLLREHQEQQGMAQQQAGPAGAAAAAAGRKGKPASSGGSRQQVAAAPSALLCLSAVNSLLSAAVSVAAVCLQEGRDDGAESAAQEAVQVAEELFKQQVVAVSLGAAGATALALSVGATALGPDAVTWGSLAQLYGLLGRWQQVANVVLAAVEHWLPGVCAGKEEAGMEGGRRSSREGEEEEKGGLQTVLAGAAAALNAAGRHTAAVQLLDGLVAAQVTVVSHPGLAGQLVEAVNNSAEAEQELVSRLAAGDEAVYESLPDVAAGGCPAKLVRLVDKDAVLALKALRGCVKGLSS